MHHTLSCQVLFSSWSSAIAECFASLGLSMAGGGNIEGNFAVKTHGPLNLWQFGAWFLAGSWRICKWPLERQRGLRFSALFRAVSSLPTRLMSDRARASEEPFLGLPCFDGSARYFGPLPHVCPHGSQKDQLNGKCKDGMGIKSSDVTSYTAGMCFWLASMIVRSFFPLK